MARVLPERVAENKTVRWAARHGIEALKLNTRGRRSWPDRMFVLPAGRPFYIEFKKVGKTASALQSIKIQQLLELGYEVEVHTNSDAAIQAIKDAYARRTNADISDHKARSLEAACVPEESAELPVRKRRGRAAA